MITAPHEDMVVENDTDISRKLFIGGLSWDVTEDDLRTHFGKYGQVLDVSIKYDAITGNPRGFGFLTYATDEAVDAAIRAQPHIIKNKQVDPKRAKSRPICKKIFVGGVDAAMPEADIKRYFEQYGPVEGIELPFDRQKNKRREFCFIIFQNEESADAACRHPKQRVGNKDCDVKKAQPQPVAQQQKRAQQAEQQQRMQGGQPGWGAYPSYPDQWGQGSSSGRGGNSRGRRPDNSRASSGAPQANNGNGSGDWSYGYAATNPPAAGNYPAGYPNYGYPANYADYYNYYGYYGGDYSSYYPGGYDGNAATGTDPHYAAQMTHKGDGHSVNSTSYSGAGAPSHHQSTGAAGHTGHSSNLATVGKARSKGGSNHQSYHPYPRGGSSAH